MTNKNQRLTTFFVFVLLLFSGINQASAAILDPDNIRGKRGWDDERAYRPSPVLFLHGFGKSDPDTWRGPKVDERLLEYFSKYYVTNPVVFPGTLEHPQTRYPYLEIISFIDEGHWTPEGQLLMARQELLDRNSSIDTYQAGDNYVQAGDRTPTSPGWADKLAEAVGQLQAVYKDKEVILAGYSMGGLAAREYISNDFKYGQSSQSVPRLIMLATPNLGSSWADLADNINRMRRAGHFIPLIGWIFSTTIEATDSIINNWLKIDIDGDAVADMTPGSNFLKTLNSRPQPQATGHFAISGKLWWHNGDGVVSLDSQEAKGILTLKDKKEIKASHGEEPARSVDEMISIKISGPEEPKEEYIFTNPLLRFIDYTTPEVEITYPEEDQHLIWGDRLILEGKVYKEFLPADSILRITLQRTGDAFMMSRLLPRQKDSFLVRLYRKLFSSISSFVYAQGEPGLGPIIPVISEKRLFADDGWDPLLSDSVVASFKEEIHFPSSGTYKVNVKVINPAGISCEEKTKNVIVFGLANLEIKVEEGLYGASSTKAGLTVVVDSRVWISWAGELEKEGWTEMNLSVDNPSFSPSKWQPLQSYFVFDTQLDKDYENNLGLHTLYGRLRKSDGQGGWIESEVVSYPWFYNGWYVKEAAGYQEEEQKEDQTLTGYIKGRADVKLGWKFPQYSYMVATVATYSSQTLGFNNRPLWFASDFNRPLTPIFTLEGYLNLDNQHYEDSWRTFMGNVPFSHSINDIKVNFGKYFIAYDYGTASGGWLNQLLTDHDFRRYIGLE